MYGISLLMRSAGKYACPRNRSHRQCIYYGSQLLSHSTIEPNLQLSPDASCVYPRQHSFQLIHSLQ